MRPLLLISLLLAACSGEEDLPTSAELYGSWTEEDAGTTRTFSFAATDDGSHVELAGLADVFTFESYPTGDAPIEVQAGQYRVEFTALSSGGSDDALVVVVITGSGAGSTFGNAILGWTGDTLTLSSESAASGRRTFTLE